MKILHRLFFGNFHSAINIVSIRILETATNYGEIITAISVFDNIISDNLYDKLAGKLSEKCVPILKHLLFDKDKNIFDNFIYSTWNLFTERKKKIKIDLNDLYEYIDADFFDLIFNGLMVYSFDGNYLIPNDETNLLRQEIIDTFDNINSIEILHTQFVNKYIPFSFAKLLEMVNHSRINQIVIAAGTYKDQSWISCLWTSIVKQCTNDQCHMNIDTTSQHGRHRVIIDWN